MGKHLNTCTHVHARANKRVAGAEAEGVVGPCNTILQYPSTYTRTLLQYTCTYSEYCNTE